MNTYIQNKLDEFDERFGIKRNHAYFSPEYDDEASANNSNEVRTFIEQALTDYHNHIVEKINSISPLESNNAIDYSVKIKSLLQDTNK